MPGSDSRLILKPKCHGLRSPGEVELVCPNSQAEISLDVSVNCLNICSKEDLGVDFGKINPRSFKVLMRRSVDH